MNPCIIIEGCWRFQYDAGTWRSFLLNDLTWEPAKWPEFLRYFFSEDGQIISNFWRWIYTNFQGTESIIPPSKQEVKGKSSTFLRAGMGYVSRCIDILVSRRVSIHVIFFSISTFGKLIGNRIRGPTPLILSLDKRQKLQHDPIAWVTELMFESRGLNHPDLFPQVERHWVSELGKLLPCSSSGFILFVHFIFLFAISEAQGLPAKPCRVCPRSLAGKFHHWCRPCEMPRDPALKFSMG